MTAAVVEGPGLPVPKYTLGASHDWPVEREFYDAEQMREYAHNPEKCRWPTPCWIA